MIDLKTFQFYRDNGANIRGEAARQGLALAKAHAALELAEDAGEAVIVWESDEDADTSWCDERELERLSQGLDSMLICRIVRPCATHGTECRHAETLACLCGIHMGPEGTRAPYARIVEAELAQEAGL